MILAPLHLVLGLIFAIVINSISEKPTQSLMGTGSLIIFWPMWLVYGICLLIILPKDFLE